MVSQGVRRGARPRAPGKDKEHSSGRGAAARDGHRPVPATKKAWRGAGITLEEVDLVELNEAFAAQSLAVLYEWGMDPDDERLNPNGGAIALGHP